jgi:hypothetical protein
VGNTYRAGQVGECQDTNRGRRSPAVQRAGCRAARRVCPRDRFCDAPRASPRSRCQMNRMHCGRREKAAEWVSVEGGRVVSCCHGDALFHEKRDTKKPKKGATALGTLQHAFVSLGTLFRKRAFASAPGAGALRARSGWCAVLCAASTRLRCDACSNAVEDRREGPVLPKSDPRGVRRRCRCVESCRMFGTFGTAGSDDTNSRTTRPSDAGRWRVTHVVIRVLKVTHVSQADGWTTAGFRASEM